MALHLAAVALAAPLLAAGLPGAGAWPAARMPRNSAVLTPPPVAAAMEMSVVWG